MKSLTRLLKSFTVNQHNKSLLIFVLSFTFLAASSCGRKPTVVRDGVEMPVEQAAKLDYSLGETYFSKRQYRKAQRAFQKIVNEIPMSLYADNAMLRLAQIYQRQKKAQEAILMLEALIQKYPMSDVQIPAKELLGRLLLSQKDFSKASRMLASIPWDQVKPIKQEKLEKLTRYAFSKTQLDQEKLYWLIETYKTHKNLSSKSRIREEIVDLIDYAATEDDLESIYQDHKNEFPGGYTSYKLARIYYHQGDFNRSRKWISIFLDRFSDHEFAINAKILSDSLARSSEVDPQAIGLILPLSGKHRVFAEQVLRGMALGIRIFDSDPQTHSKIKIFIEDIGTNPEQAAASVDKLILEKKVIAVIGPLFLRTTQLAALAALKHRVPLISMTPSEGITEIGPFIFRNSLTKSEQANGLAYLAAKILGIRRMAILRPENTYGREFARLFQKEFEKRGGLIYATEAYAPQSNNFGRPIKKLVGLWPLKERLHQICSEEEAKERDQMRLLQPEVPICYTEKNLPPIVKFEAIFIPDGYEKAMQILPALNYYDVQGIQILGTNLWNTIDIFHGRNTGYLQGAIFLDGFFKGKKTEPVPGFVQKYYSVYGAEPGVLEAQAYDTITMVMKVLQKDKPRSRKSFAQALARIRNFPGVSGLTSFNSSRDARRKLTPLTIEGNQIVELR